MHLNHILELILPLDAERFNEIFNRDYSKSEYSGGTKYIDRTLESKGIIITFHDKTYKKKILLTVNLNVLLNADLTDQDNAAKMIGKLEKQIDKYFGGIYSLDDFSLSKLFLITDIDVGSRARAADFIRVLKRIRMVKWFSPMRDKLIGDDISFQLAGNSNGVNFLVYDLEGWLKERAIELDSESIKALAKNSKGLLRAEVRLMKANAIRALTDELLPSAQIVELCGKSQKLFLEVFQWVVPFGTFYKKDQAVEIIRREVKDQKLMRRMLRIVTLVSEKKSLLLAQKALSYRRIDKVMEKFRDIELSPITISARHDVKMLDNLYKFM